MDRLGGSGRSSTGESVLAIGDAPNYPRVESAIGTTIIGHRSNLTVNPRVVYVIPTHNRREDLRAAVRSIREQDYDAQEVVVVSDQATDGTRDLFAPGGAFDCEDVSFHHSDDHVGAPGARNVGVDMADGDIYVFLDDDTVLPNRTTTRSIVEAFDDEADLGALAFCIENYHSGEILSDEFPHRSRAPTREQPFDTTYFIGAGCAIRAQALADAGGFPASFDPNRFEEVDLAFRLIDSGYRIRYTPSIVVLHKRSPAGRKPTKDAIRYDFENRVKTAVRNLPWRYVVVSGLLWGLYTVLRAGGDPRPLVRGLRGLLAARTALLDQRSVLDEDALAYVRKHDGRLYY